MTASDAELTPGTIRNATAGAGHLTRRKLLEAAVEHFSARHFDDVAASDITETAGVAQGLLFHYFENKRGIYLEALRDAANRLNAATTPPPGDGPPGKQFRQMLRAHFEYLSEHDDLASFWSLVAAAATLKRGKSSISHAGTPSNGPLSYSNSTSPARHCD